MTQIELTEGFNFLKVHFVHLNAGLLYTEVDKILHVYSVSDLSTPIASYEIDNHCYSCIIADSQVYLGCK
jgi:hypothetical protein